ncbi:flagellar export protein FliJ [Biostraticola tofi]|uniref:Flagellar FliJ protein n=1 Tax=Biostraticola tofi TaxID=466109 RepID=A0A4R3YUU6_9GAMM|nr:flagellar export protein FliJ [Biostraticola tofi]TCV95558.1 flagellar FliJ protein [Biostraticola tofi]
MVSASPMNTLRELAERALEEAIMQLGACRVAHNQAVEQLNQLMNYEQEYRQQLQQDMTDIGIQADKWINYQNFIGSLYKVVTFHRQQVSVCHARMQNAMVHLHLKKQRLSAFESLKQRADTAKQLVENRLDQKKMDEFAQRATAKRES